MRGKRAKSIRSFARHVATVPPNHFIEIRHARKDGVHVTFAHEPGSPEAIANHIKQGLLRKRRRPQNAS